MTPKDRYRYNQAGREWEEHHPKDAKLLFQTYLRDWAEPGADHNQGFQSFCPEFPAWLSGYMDRHAEKELARTADTDSRRWLLAKFDLAWHSKNPLAIVGASRQTKSTAAETHARAYPGRARLVTCPAASGVMAWLHKHADVYGMAYRDAGRQAVLAARVNRVAKLGLLHLYDEAHYLIPTRYSRPTKSSSGTPPHRLNWIREHLIDRHTPCVLLATPQTMEQTLSEYARKSGYNLEQWNLRLGKVLAMPEAEFSEEELRAVASKHFPGLDGKALNILCLAARSSPHPLQFLPRVGRFALALAAQRGATEITLADVREAAMLEGMELPELTLPRPGKRVADAGRSLAAEPLQAPCREVAPALRNPACAVA